MIKENGLINNINSQILSVFHNAYTAWIILLVSICLTFIGWKVSSNFSNQLAKDRFEFRVIEIETGIKERMDIYEQALRGGVALFNTNDEVTRDQWKKYVASLDINKYWPGIQGMGYSQFIPTDQVEEHINAIRNEGFKEYTIKPEGPRDEYTSIIYLEPFDWRNQRAFGYDMWSNEYRRIAMDRARKSGEASTSGIITLVQETKEDVQRGFLTYLPVYQQEMPLNTIDERILAFKGWVYSPFRSGDLMKGIIGVTDLNYDFEIYDGTNITNDNLLFDSDSSAHTEDQNHAPQFSVNLPLEIQGRQWSLYVHSSRPAELAEASLPRMIAISGVVIDLLLFYVILALSTMRKNAVNLANKMSVKVMDERRLLRTVIDNIPINIHVKNEDSVITLVNKAEFKIWGGNDEQETLTKMNEALLIPEIIAQDKDVLDGEILNDFERKHICPDGNESLLVISKYLLRGANEEKEGILVISRDITAQRATEETMLSMQKMLEQTSQVAKVGGWEYKTSDKNIVFSETAKNILNVDQGQKITTDFIIDNLHNGHKESFRNLIDKGLSEGETYEAELLFDSDNLTKWIRIIGKVLITSGNHQKFYGTIQDIQTEKLTQLELQKAKIRLELATGHAGIGIWEFNKHTNQIVWDKNMFSLYGLEEKTKHIDYENWKKYLHPEDLSKTILQLEKAFQGENNFNTEFRIIWPNGEVRYIRAIAAVERDENNEAFNMIGTNWDITTEKLLQESLIESSQKDKSANKAKSEFLANMSHEIRTPLNGIIGFTDLLLKTELSEMQKNYLQSVFYSGNSLLDLVNDILDFSKIEAGKLQIHSEKIDTWELANQVIEIVKYKAYEKNIELLVAIDKEVPRFIWADPIRLKQILINLLGNAIKFTDEGTVELRISLDKINPQDQRSIIFSVLDTGIGIEESKQQLIFEAFSQADFSMTRKYGGTGLGLAISNQLLQLMDSQLEVKSEVGKGSDFYFTLNPEKEEIVSPEDSNLFKNALIIEPNERSGEIINLILKQKNILSTVVNDGFSAIQALSNTNFDIIITDSLVPPFSELEMINKISKLITDKKQIPIIVTIKEPVNNNDDTIELNKQSNIYFLLKPASHYNIHSMMKKIENDLSHKSDLHGDEENLGSSDLKQLNQLNSKILIVDDNPINLILAESIVKHLIPKASIKKANNGEEAINRYKEEVPDLILMDVQMPVMSGYDASENIRVLEQDAAFHTPIIALTAGTVKGEKDKCLEFGMDDYLSKPVTSEKMKSFLIKHLVLMPATHEPTNIADQAPIVHIDEEKLMKDFGNDISVFKEVLTLVTNGKLLNDYYPLEEAINKNEVKETDAAIHKLKGTCRGLHFEHLQNLLAILKSLSPYNSGECKQALKSIFEEVNYLEDSLKEKLNE